MPAPRRLSCPGPLQDIFPGGAKTRGRSKPTRRLSCPGACQDVVSAGIEKHLPEEGEHLISRNVRLRRLFWREAKEAFQQRTREEERLKHAIFIVYDVVKSIVRRARVVECLRYNVKETQRKRAVEAEEAAQKAEIAAKEAKEAEKLHLQAEAEAKAKAEEMARHELAMMQPKVAEICKEDLPPEKQKSVTQPELHSVLSSISLLAGSLLKLREIATLDLANYEHMSNEMEDIQRRALEAISNLMQSIERVVCSTAGGLEATGRGAPRTALDVGTTLSSTRRLLDGLSDALEASEPETFLEFARSGALDQTIAEVISSRGEILNVLDELDEKSSMDEESLLAPPRRNNSRLAWGETKEEEKASPVQTCLTEDTVQYQVGSKMHSRLQDREVHAVRPVHTDSESETDLEAYSSHSSSAVAAPNRVAEEAAPELNGEHADIVATRFPYSRILPLQGAQAWLAENSGSGTDDPIEHCLHGMVQPDSRLPAETFTSQAHDWIMDYSMSADAKPLLVEAELDCSRTLKPNPTRVETSVHVPQPQKPRQFANRQQVMGHLAVSEEWMSLAGADTVATVHMEGCRSEKRESRCRAQPHRRSSDVVKRRSCGLDLEAVCPAQQENPAKQARQKMIGRNLKLPAHGPPLVNPLGSSATCSNNGMLLSVKGEQPCNQGLERSTVTSMPSWQDAVISPRVLPRRPVWRVAQAELPRLELQPGQAGWDSLESASRMGLAGALSPLPPPKSTVSSPRPKSRQVLTQQTDRLSQMSQMNGSSWAERSLSPGRPFSEAEKPHRVPRLNADRFKTG
eukprot:TRINITY_DN113978_c0_g1_i1.p1 TRINITY_DN113978_c0_g1~~TRINITY_DN113978_c0_g1_i1.p1  ORF type:complete len:800 (-),score=137.36 TRINITY_DN113978_c0_g1_i1:77-2476(-)